MRDLIDRQAAIDAIDTGNLHRGIVEALQNIISELPSAESEVVHCKNCKHYICYDDDEFPDDQPEWFCHHPELYRDDPYDFAALATSPDDFCSRGERREDG